MNIFYLVSTSKIFFFFFWGGGGGGGREVTRVSKFYQLRIQISNKEKKSFFWGGGGGLVGEVSGRLELVIFFFYYEPNFFSVGRGGEGGYSK